MSTVTASVSPLQLFYWKVKFEDGFIFSQYDPAGVEIQFKDFVTPENYYLKDGKRLLNINSNCFANLERMHGRAIQVGWYPFDQALIDQIKKANPDANCQLMENPVPHAVNIPPQGFAYLKKSIDVQYSMNMGKKTADTRTLHGYQSDLFFGYLMRDGLTTGSISHIDLNLKEKQQ